MNTNHRPRAGASSEERNLAPCIVLFAQPLGFVPLVGLPQGGGGSGMVFFIQLVAIIAIFYFLLIRPQRKEQQHLTIVTAENTRLVIERSKIATLTDPRSS